MSNEDDEPKPLLMTVVGAGGIGSCLLDLLAPALSNGALAASLGGVRIRVMDGDVVEACNIAHQRFTTPDIGRQKAEVLAARHASLAVVAVEVVACGENLRRSEQIAGEDIVVVAVDRPEPRRLVHSQFDGTWLDLRCRGDAMLNLDNSCDAADLDRMTPTHEPLSCQLSGAIESGNIEFGFALAAVHGAQWCIQHLRARAGADTRPPAAGALSITHGVLQTFIQDAPATSPAAPLTRPARASKHWTSEEEMRLLAEAEHGMQLEQVVASHGRSAGAIFRRLCRLALPIRDRGDAS